MKLSKKSFLKKDKLLCSTNMLYIVLVVFVVNLIQFLHRKDYESMFLFIVISLCVYLFNKNILIVMLIPLLLVNTLIFLRFVFNRNKYTETFTDATGELLISNYNSLNKQLVQQWVTKNMPEETDDNNPVVYTEFDKKIDGFDEQYKYSLKEIIENIKTNKLSEDSTNYNATPIEDFEEYISKLSDDAGNPDFMKKYKKEVDFILKGKLNEMKEDFEKMEVEVTETNDNEEDGDNKEDTEATEGMKDKINMSEFSDETKNLIAGLDQMNPVMEKSLKILESMDIDKMQNMMEKFNNFNQKK
jgi:hypothetical protein